MTTRYRPAEMVLPGHPDKVADAIADSIVEHAARREQRALCGVEVAVHRNQVFVTGRVACQDAESIDVQAIARDVFLAAGYDRQWHPAPDDLVVTSDLCLGPLNPGEDEFRAFADDQSIVTGYACDLPSTNYLPPEQWLVHQIGRGLHVLRSEQPGLCLGPDGKLMLVLAESDDSLEVELFTASLQQDARGPVIELNRAVREVVSNALEQQAALTPALSGRVPDQFLVNAAGDFSIGGTEGDNGLSGKKLVVDAYGPRAPIGGGALSGKDFYKADRAGAILARRLARAVVMTGAARECNATLIFTPGASHARILRLEDESGTLLDMDRWGRLLDLSLSGCGNRYAQVTGLADVALWGHFTAPGLPWESVSFDGSRSCH